LVSGVFRASATRSLADSLAAAFKLQVTQTPSGDLLLSQPDI
jgi:ferric-dicitrate binding protein FerR (iron transport regulator)